MRPPADRRLDLNGTGVDLPAPPRPRYGLSSRVVLAVAALLSALTSTTRRPGSDARRTFDGMAFARRRQLQLLGDLGTADSSDRVALAAFPVRAARTAAAPFSFTCRPSRCSRFAHIAVMAGVQWWLRWRPGDVRPGGRRSSARRSELRLGDDDVLGHRRPQSRGALLSRVARPGRCAPRSSRPSSSKRGWRRCSSSCSRTSCSTPCTRSRR